MIDGFPRAVDQAQMFEQQVTEIQTILEVQIPNTKMTERLTERCKTSKRMDDTADIIKKRVSNYDD